MRLHLLKTWPQFFGQLWPREEWSRFEGRETGRTITFQVTSLVEAGELPAGMLPDDVVVMGLRELERSEPGPYVPDPTSLLMDIRTDFRRRFGP
jgi:hypothetical protein